MNTEQDLISLFDESNNQAIEQIAVKEQYDNEFMPVMYKIVKAGYSTSDPIDTYKVEQGRFEMAKGLAVRKAKMLGDCVVYEVVKRSEIFKGRIVYRETERLVIEITSPLVKSKTILYKSGHSRKRRLNN